MRAHYAPRAGLANALQPFVITSPLKISTTSALRRNRLPLLEGLGRPRSPGGREGAPLGEVSSRSQQTALLPRPGSWESQPQPPSEGARALMGGPGEWGGGAWPDSQPAIRGSVCRHGFLEALKGERAAGRALLSGRGSKGLVLDPAVSLCFLHSVQSSCRRHRVWRRWRSCLPAAPACIEAPRALAPAAPLLLPPS